MKKIWVLFAVVLAGMMIAGCSKAMGEETEPGQDAAGNVVVLEESSKQPEKTDEADGKPENTMQQTQNTDGDAQKPAADKEDGQESQEQEKQQEDAQTDVVQESKGSRLQIVFLGDSILDGYRDETGIAYLTGVYCNADVYNLAIGGTTAALTKYEKGEYDQWTSKSLQGIVHVLCGDVSSGLLDGTAAGESYAMCNMADTDYFVIGYGMNDFLSGIPLNDTEDFYDEYTYVGALRIAVQNLRNAYPNAEIVLCSPNYGHFWAKEGYYAGDGNTADYGGGKLVEYYRVCGNVSADMNTLFLNTYEGIGLDAYTADEYLEDGVHLSKVGREAYARKLSEIILEHEETRNN